MTHAQNNEDDILSRFFGNQISGFYIDVGAFDGITYSNTYLFEQRGWKGLCIEANPDTFHKLAENRESGCIHMAVIGTEGQNEATLYLSQMAILATLSTDHQKEIATIHKNVKLEYEGLTPITVPAATLDNLLAQFNPPPIDLLSIDVEWTNADVLQGFTFSKWQPRVMVIETGDGVQEAMGAGGYHFVAEHGSNLFYVRDRRDVHRMRRAMEIDSKVSALVSVYNGEPFIHGRLNDLLAQTLYAQGRLEIVVIDAGSTDSTQAICREYLDRITYIRSPREPMYTSLNRGIRIAAGEYLTTSNVDDRLRPDALERMADTLDANHDIGVVYTDNYVTTTPNAVWGGVYELCREYPYANGRLNWPDYDRRLLKEYCYIGNQPLWRKDLHTQAGLFDESYLVAGDYELWLRLAAQGVNMRRTDEILGLFYWNASQQGRAFAEQSNMESRRALLQWREHLG